MQYKLSEYQIQCALIDYLDILLASGKQIYYSALCQSTFTKSWAVKTKNKKMGLKPGIPDLFLIINKQPFFLELKTDKGRLSDYQKDWIEAINECSESQGLKAHVAYGLDDARKIIDEYVFGKRDKHCGDRLR